MTWITNPLGYKKTTWGDAPLRPADPLKYKHVSKYNFEYDCKNLNWKETNIFAKTAVK